MPANTAPQFTVHVNEPLEYVNGTVLYRATPPGAMFHFADFDDAERTVKSILTPHGTIVRVIRVTIHGHLVAYEMYPHHALDLHRRNEQQRQREEEERQLRPYFRPYFRLLVRIEPDGTSVWSDRHYYLEEHEEEKRQREAEERQQQQRIDANGTST